MVHSGSRTFYQVRRGPLNRSGHSLVRPHLSLVMGSSFWKGLARGKQPSLKGSDYHPTRIPVSNHGSGYPIRWGLDSDTNNKWGPNHLSYWDPAWSTGREAVSTKGLTQGCTPAPASQACI